MRIFGVAVIAVLLVAAIPINTVLVQKALAQSGVNWPMFHFNTEHTGTTPEVVRPPLQLEWSVGGSILTSSSVSDGVVYVAPSYVRAYNADTGALIWQSDHGPNGWLWGSPAVADGCVYVGSADMPFYYVYCLNATTGNIIWTYAAGDWTAWSSPAVSGGVVYIGSDDGKVYALNSSTGALKWNYATGDIIRSSPAVSGGVVYIGSFDSNVYALDADTGALKWNYVTGGWVESSPAVSDGVVYVGSYDKNIYALDARTGALKWNYVAWAYVAASPAVSGDVVYVGANAFSRAPNHDVGVDGVIVAKTVVGGYSAVLGEGLGLNMSVTVTNFGTFTEIFNVTIYANTTQEASENITLTSGQSAIVNVSWRTNPPTLAYGNYTISACADTVEGETDIENNNNSNVGLLVVAGAGDLTGGTANAFDFVPDGNVNIIDVAVVSKVMTQNSPPAPANCDVSGPTVGMPDGKIDISDVALAAKHFGNHYTYP